MFVREKRNASGLVGVQVIDKSSGRYRVLKTIGSSRDAAQVAALVLEGEAFIKQAKGQAELDFKGVDQLFDQFLDSIREVNVFGSQLLLGKIYDQIGFLELDDDMLRKLVIARLCFPVSKRKTATYLQYYQGFEVDEDQIFRYLDKLQGGYKERIQQISFAHNHKVLGGQMSLVFYDVTTLFFEIEAEDNLRKMGFSKEGYAFRNLPGIGRL